MDLATAADGELDREVLDRQQHVTVAEVGLP
jgi:hypothetical protein